MRNFIIIGIIIMLAACGSSSNNRGYKIRGTTPHAMFKDSSKQQFVVSVYDTGDQAQINSSIAEILTNEAACANGFIVEDIDVSGTGKIDGAKVNLLEYYGRCK